MQRLIVANLAVVFVSGLALAQSRDQGRTSSPKVNAVDITKMGPWTRKPANEQRVNREISEFIKQEEELMKRGDFNASIARIDFPIFMVTDDSQGTPMAKEYRRDEYVSMMKPFFENWPKEAKVTHNPTITVLSDSLATVADNFTMTIGTQKMSGRSHSLLIKRDGEWKWKSMAEPGWGDVAETGAYGSETNHIKK